MSKQIFQKVVIVVSILAVIIVAVLLIKRPFFASAKDRVSALLHSSEKIRVKDFSEKIISRGFLSKFYESFGYNKFWTDSTRQNDNYRDMLIEMLHHADSLGLDRKDYHEDYVTKFDSLSHLPNFDYSAYESENEVIFTDAALTFLYHVAYGKEIDIGYNGVKYNIDSARILSVYKNLLATRNWRNALDSIEPKISQYVTLKKELNRMNTYLQNNPGLDTMLVSAEPDDQGTVINKLKAYGVMDETIDNDSVNGDILKKGVKGFQKMMSADTTGKLDDKTVAALNFSLVTRVAQIKESLNYWRWTGRLKEREFILVNIPAARLQIVKSDSSKDVGMKVIVGKLTTQTPAFTSYITKVIAYPYWTVPFDIATKEMLPKIKKSMDYLDENNLQVINGKGVEIDPTTLDWKRYSTKYFPYTIRQGTGCDNSLGVLKFDLNSPYSIYLHDTDAKSLFSQKNRFLSHGCVRLEKPMMLAEFVLNQGLDTSTIASLNKCMTDQKQEEFRVKKPVPVLILYMPADIDETGALRFYKDVYGIEEKMPV